MSGRIALGAGAACFLLLGALGVWAATLVASAGAACPDAGAATGFETLSPWPPGERCGSGADATVNSAIPWAAPAIVALVGAAGLVLALGLAAQIAILRSRVLPARELREPEPAPVMALQVIDGADDVADTPFRAPADDLRHAA